MRLHKLFCRCQNLLLSDFVGKSSCLSFTKNNAFISAHKLPRSFKRVSQLTYKPRDTVVKFFPSFLYNTSTLISYIFSNTFHHMKWSFLYVLVTLSLHKKWSFPLRMSSVNHQIRRFLRIWSHLLNKPLMENFIFCAVFAARPFVS